MESRFSVTIPVTSPDSPNTKRPIVVLYGWMGSSQRSVQKYADFYNNQGYITVYCIASMRELFWDRMKLKTIASSTLDVLKKHDIQQHPLFFHVFSNGGGFVYCKMLDVLKERKNVKDASDVSDVNVCGAIFDSCPSDTSTVGFYRAIKTALGRSNSFLRHFVSINAFIWLAVGKFIYHVVHILLRRSREWRYHTELAEHDGEWAELYLYSMRDQICSFEFIRSMAAKRQDRGIAVTEICWEDSEHCQHLLKHRDCYIQACLQFVEQQHKQ